ncbi:alpha/beta fold hydrolase [Streptomyces sp. 549]|uniref:alpha/beta fold hydrolase n=1 Tax=Streptomyces sp. 549 TaxID=3049076 RepID=UPI0024C470BF|nr:alpha/beta fold hydrolase [Streptomyces sp. 549]MDK1474962.1 alpha/beta fold hydrolase [Streptomyces sp. 549]
MPRTSVRRCRFHTPSGRLAGLHAAPAPSLDRGTSVVLVPGLLGSKEDFAFLLPLLAQAGFDAYAYDQRGQYESDGPHDPEAYTVAALAADLDLVLDQVRHPHRVQVLGAGFGGLVAASATGVRDGRVDGLTLLGCPAGLLPEQRLRMRVTAGAVQTLGAVRTVRLMLAHRERPRSGDHPHPALHRVARERLTATRPAHYLGVVRSWAAAEPLAPLGGPAVDLPVLVLHGTRDAVFGADDYARTARQLGAALTAVPRAGHSAQVHRPQAVARALQGFWSRAAGGNACPAVPHPAACPDLTRSATASGLSGPGQPGAARGPAA